MRPRTYNPAQLTPDELKKSFIARRFELEEMLRVVREHEPGVPRQHMLILGSRGMGKTTLGLRFLQAIRDTPELEARWQPIPFDEVSYGITEMPEFWLSALHHLSRETGEDRWRCRADELSRNELDPRRRGDYALASLLDFCSERRRQVILFVENLDGIFDQFTDKYATHELRSVLIEQPQILLVGSANAMFPEIQKYDRAFYEFFRLIRLEGLDIESCTAIVEETFTRENRGGSGVLTSTDRGRIKTIRTLVNGNSRLMVFASEIMARSPLATTFEVLEALIDRDAPYYEAKIDSLPVQARKVFHYLAIQWTPLRAREISDEVNLTASHVSAQLRQLIQKGYVRDVHLPHESRARYEVVDRLFNFYCLMRFSGPGRKRLFRLVDSLQDLTGEIGFNSLYFTVLRSMPRRLSSTTASSDTSDSENATQSPAEERWDTPLRGDVHQSENAHQELEEAMEGSKKREFRLIDSVFTGNHHWLANEPDKALEVWQQATSHVQLDNDETVREHAASCIVLTCFAQSELAGNDLESLPKCKELAQKAVELAPNASIPLQLMARVLAHTGEWEDAIELSRRSEKSRRAGESTTLLGTLTRIAAAGYTDKVRSLMKGTHLRDDLEPLWYALNVDLGAKVEPLPLEMKDAAMEIHKLFNPKAVAASRVTP